MRSYYAADMTASSTSHVCTHICTDISLAYSVDADDAFMFHALRAGAIEASGLTFSHRREHTAALNQLAIEGGADVVAVSLGVYPAIAANYQLLPHGASVGRGYGPVVVAPGGDDGTAYCMQTYRSYDPRSGTYLGLDGFRHPCP